MESIDFNSVGIGKNLSENDIQNFIKSFDNMIENILPFINDLYLLLSEFTSIYYLILNCN